MPIEILRFTQDDGEEWDRRTRRAPDDIIEFRYDDRLQYYHKYKYRLEKPG